MPYKLNGTYYTLSELAEEFGIKISAMGYYITRGDYEKTQFGGPRGGVCLIREDVAERIRQDRQCLKTPWGTTHSLEFAAKRLGCGISEILENVRDIKKKGEDRSRWRIKCEDFKLIEALRNGKTRRVDWSKVKTVMEALNEG